MKIKTKKMEEDQFFQQRKEVLAMWKTGKEVDLKEAVEYHKSIPVEKNGALKTLEAKKTGRLNYSAHQEPTQLPLIRNFSGTVEKSAG